MSKLTLSAMALSAFTLAGCYDNDLTIEEAQQQMNTAFEEIDALPSYTQDRFQDIRDEDGMCAVAYRDRERGVRYDFNGIAIVSYLPQAVQVACDDLYSAFNHVSLDLAVENVEMLSRQESHYSIDTFKKEVADTARSRSYSLEGISTFGLK